MESLRVCAVGLAAASIVLCSATQSGVLAQTEGTGTISGRVQVVAPPARRLATAGAYPGRIVGTRTTRETSELDNVVVFVDTTPVHAPPQRVTIRQTNEEFVPHVVALTVGSTVEFPNDDRIFHNVFSLSHAATFDLGRYPRHSSRSWTFTTPGIVKVFCHLHSHMSATVRVFPHPYFTIPDRDGRFTVPNVPAGHYDVTAWHERAGEVTHRAALERGATADLTFSLPLTDPE